MASGNEGLSIDGEATSTKRSSGGPFWGSDLYMTYKASNSEARPRLYGIGLYRMSDRWCEG